MTAAVSVDDSNEDDDEDDGVFLKQDTGAPPVPAAIVRRPVSAPVSRVPQHQQQGLTQLAAPQQQQRPSSAVHRDSAQQRQQQEAFAALRVEGAARVVPAAGSERGLDVLPPLPSATSSVSAWRLGLDATCVSGAAAQDLQQEQQQQRRPLYTRPSSAARFMRGGPSSSTSAAGVTDMGRLAQGLVDLFAGGKVNDTLLDTIYAELCHQTQQVLAAQQQGQEPPSPSEQPRGPGTFSVASSARGSSSSSAPGGGGVLPSVLLDWLDANVSDFGDKRFFERLIGGAMARRSLSKDHVALVLLRLSKQ